MQKPSPTVRKCIGNLQHLTSFIWLHHHWHLSLSTSVTAAVSLGRLLTVTGQAGQDVEFLCSDWKVWQSVNQHEKYFCRSPCAEHIRSPYGKPQHKGRIAITNRGKNLLVRITNLTIEDTGKYYCAVDRPFMKDVLIEVNLQVLQSKFLDYLKF